MKYVLLLRGINVGGNNRVEMARLRSLLERQGYTNVKTHINSGNAIFDATTAPDATKIQSEFKKEFGFDIPALILPGKDIVRIAEAIPSDWDNDYTNQKSDVLYLFKEANTPEVLEIIGAKPEIETFLYIDGAVLTNISREYQSRGSLQKIVGTKLYKQVTIRNSRTARKLAELVQQ